MYSVKNNLERPQADFLHGSMNKNLLNLKINDNHSAAVNSLEI